MLRTIYMRPRRARPAAAAPAGSSVFNLFLRAVLVRSDLPCVHTVLRSCTSSTDGTAYLYSYKSYITYR